MSSRCTDDLAFAVELARRAGALLSRSYERLERIDYKSKRDVVTDADYASERLVIDAIKAAHPGDAILAEPGLQVPHPHLHERAFALVPLVEVDRNALIPGHGPARDALAALAYEAVEGVG